MMHELAQNFLSLILINLVPKVVIGLQPIKTRAELNSSASTVLKIFELDLS